MCENHFQTSAHGFAYLPGSQHDQDHEQFVQYPISTSTSSSSPLTLHTFMSPSLPESHFQGSGILGWDDMVDNSDVQNSIHGLSQLGKHKHDNGYPDRPCLDSQLGMKNKSWRELGRYLPLSQHGRPQPQYCPGDNFTIQHPTLSHRDSSSLSTSECVSPSLPESSYTGFPATDGNEIEDNSDMQSNSYSTLEARSPRVENGMPYNSFTITGGIHNYQAAELGQNLAVPGHDSTTNVASPFGPPVTELCNPFYSPNHDALLVERQPDYSANSYSGIGSHFPLDKTPVFEGNPFMDPVFSQDLSTAVYLNPDSIAAGQPSSEYDLEDFNLNLSTDLPVPPTVLTARAHLNSPCCEVSIPITHTDRAVMPTKATTWTASAMDYL
ncbi:MAG: hypothetical protein ASARMPRED_005056 [Alectoria sarmentosa]|nr:MAG: hypothetical protein ASARMPRED_005056 [Alectoria sarmentosa]